MDNNNLKEVRATERWSSVFDDYVKTYPLENYYLNLDGIIDATEWTNANNPKIMCYLKEAYRGETNPYLSAAVYPLTLHIYGWSKPYKMWQNVNLWINAIREHYCNLTALDNTLPTVAVANIIKSFRRSNVDVNVKHIGNTITKPADIKAHFQKDIDLLIAQYKEIAPKILIWCAGSGTIKFLATLLAIDEIDTAYDYCSIPTNNLSVYTPKATYSQLPIVFHAYHPASVTKKTTAKDFEEIIAEIKNR